MDPRPEPTRYRFDTYELDLRACELRRAGYKVHVQEQPLRVLSMLVERPGEVVTRDELRQRLWSDHTFVDFEQGLNSAVRRLREALRDSAENPQFIETVARHGYRFVAPVERMAPAVASTPEAVAKGPTRSRWRSTAAAIVLAGLVVGGLAVWMQSSRVPPAHARRSVIAVLPFANLSGDPGEEYLSDGLTDEMIARLGTLRPAGLGVIALTSAMHYKGTRKRVDEIGRELAADYVLEGSVRSADGRLRITTRLVQTSDQTPLWTETYDRPLQDVLVLQGEVAAAVAERIRIELSPAEKARLSAGRAVDPEAHDLYLKGRYAWNRRTAEGLREARRAFEAAVARDPGYAAAYAGLADTFSLLTYYSGAPPSDAFPRAKGFARRALSLDPENAEAHTSLAYVAHRYEWDWKEAERAYTRALALNPSYGTARHWYAEFLIVQGRLAQADRELEQALRLDPLSPRIALDRGLTAYFTGDYERAAANARQVLARHPDFVAARVALREALDAHGDVEGATTQARRIAELVDAEPRRASELEAARRKGGSAAYFQKALALARDGWPSLETPSHLANRAAAAGDREQALRLLEEAHRVRDDELVWIAVEPWYRPLHADPRFRRIVADMKLSLATPPPTDTPTRP